MTTIQQMQDKLDDAVATIQVADLTGKETVVLQKLSEEIDAIIDDADDAEKLKRYNAFKCIWLDFVTYINDKYSAQVGRIDAGVLRPFVKQVLDEKIASVTPEPVEE